ncbi:MAG: MFS transporter [Saprospiraceae bacterium]|nr:MFS transporter [Saprospiraceae bacterium]
MLLKFYHHWLNSYRGIPRMIWFLSLVNLINRCGAMVISFITLYLTQHLHFSIAEAGYVMGFFGAGAMLGAYIGGRLTDRTGYRPVMFWSLIINGLILILMLQVQGFWPMCAAVFTLSVSSEIFRPANSVAISHNSIPENRTRAISLYRMSANMGWTVAPALGGLLATLGWNWLFWVDGLTCIGAALMLRRLPAGKMSVEEKNVDPQEEPVVAPVRVSPFHDRSFVWFILLTMLNAVVFMQILWTVPVFFKEAYHWTEAQIGLIMALNGLIVFVVEMPLIFRIEGRQLPVFYIRLGLVMYVLAYLAFIAPAAAVVAAIAYMIFISFGEMFVMPFSSNYVMGRSPKGQLGQYMGIYTMAYSCSNILAPLLGTQIIAAWGYTALWSLAAVLATAVWAGFWVLEQRGHYA